MKIAIILVAITILQLSEGSVCPSSYPYAYARGSKCCAFNKERKNALLSSCDGGDIGIDSNCCAHYASHDCPSPPCRDFKLCEVTSVKVPEFDEKPTYAGEDIVGITSAGSCTGKGESKLSLSHAKSIEEKVELTLADRSDMDWEESSSISVVGMAAFWSFGAMIAGTWGEAHGGKRSVTESRSKSTATTITTSSSNTASFKLPGAAILMATTQQFVLDRKDTPVEVTASCMVGAPEPEDCILEGTNLPNGDIRASFDEEGQGKFKRCVEDCRNDPECSAVTYVDYANWFRPYAKCYLKNNKHESNSGCQLFTSCSSAKIGQCGNTNIDVSGLNREIKQFDSTMDFKSYSYSSTHFTPINTGKLGKCTDELISCIKDIPYNFKDFFGDITAIEDQFTSCKDTHGKKKNGGKKEKKEKKDKGKKDKKNKKDKKKKGVL